MTREPPQFEKGDWLPITPAESQHTPARQPLWIYKREPAGMGEWCYRIYRNNHYMLYAESESIAMIICNGLNRDEQATHTSPPVIQPKRERIWIPSEIENFLPYGLNSQLVEHIENLCNSKAKAAREQEQQRINAVIKELEHLRDGQYNDVVGHNVRYAYDYVIILLRARQGGVSE